MANLRTIMKIFRVAQRASWRDDDQRLKQVLGSSAEGWPPIFHGSASPCKSQEVDASWRK
jgi:hypothetical protein